VGTGAQSGVVFGSAIVNGTLVDYRIDIERSGAGHFISFTTPISSVGASTNGRTGRIVFLR
jgi:hypothetical protein